MSDATLLGAQQPRGLVAAMKVELVADLGLQVGEAPTWMARQGAIYWIDIKAPSLSRMVLESGAMRHWTLPSEIGGFAFHRDAQAAVVALRTGIFDLDLTDGGLTRLAPPPFDPRLFRFNEAACDSTGRFWIGSMFDPLHGARKPPRTASLHSFTLAGGLRPEPDAAQVHNGMAWSPDGTRFYLSDSPGRTIAVFAFDARRGIVGGRRVFATLPREGGVPDGAAIDSQGGYWCALHGGGCLHRYEPDGRLDRVIELPVSQPTMCSFAGDALDWLYITSARDGLSQAQCRAQPLAGGLFRLKPGVTGQPKRIDIA